MQRRLFITLAAAGVASLLSACAAAASPVAPTMKPVGSPTKSPRPTLRPTLAPTPTPTPTPTTPNLTKIPLPPGALTELPSDAGPGALLAWTVDDGSDSTVIRKYVEFAKTSGTRLTFFANGCYDGWTTNADLLRPLVASGQIQLANHTFDHVDLTSVSDDEVVDQLQKNHDFLFETYGVDARPYFRPPYGFRDHRTDRLAASIGYTTPVLWYGSLSDSGMLTPEQIVGFADQWFLPQHIVIGHLNFSPVTEVFAELGAIIQNRGLQTVTLDDVFARP